MNPLRKNTWLGMLGLLSLLLVTGGCEKLRARDQLNKGVAAYKAAQYGSAIEYFKSAVELDPSLTNAKLYLATAYANQYVPGSEQEENLKVGERAIAEFEEVLKSDPNNVASVQGIANMYFQMKRMSDAKDFYQKLIALDPTNPDAYYSVGVIDWTMTYQPRMELKARLKVPADQPIKDEKARQELADRNAPLVQEGMDVLNKALELRPDYDDAMAYLNLLYRERADLEAADQRGATLKMADSWMEKSLEIKKIKAAKPKPAEG